jgi:hypothetical protein
VHAVALGRGAAPVGHAIANGLKREQDRDEGIQLLHLGNIESLVSLAAGETSAS